MNALTMPNVLIIKLVSNINVKILVEDSVELMQCVILVDTLQFAHVIQDTTEMHLLNVIPSKLQPLDLLWLLILHRVPFVRI